MKKDVSWNGKLFCKEVAEDGKMENCSRIKGRLGGRLGKDNVREAWKDYFKRLYDGDTKEQITVNM